jgi:uncharacterized membrane protein
MRTPASISKHPIHPMLIVFSIGLWIFALACDLICLAGASGYAWITVAFYSMVDGLIGVYIVLARRPDDACVWRRRKACAAAATCSRTR